MKYKISAKPKMTAVMLSLLFSAAAAASLVPAPAVYSAPAENAVTKNIPVYRKSLDENETVECLFYDDMPNVPYMTLEQYYKTFMEGTMSVTADGGGVYTYTESICGDSARIDTQTDVFTADDLASFIATPVYKMKDHKYVLNGPDRLVQVSGVQYSKPADAAAIDLGKYSIDVRERDGAAYYPFATLSDLFGNTDVITAVYDSGKIFFVSYYNDINGGLAIDSDSSYLSSFKNGQRPADMIIMAYRELCMSIETFYSYPAARNKFAEKMKTMGLDAALTMYDPKTKQLLLSGSGGSYLSGLYRLFNYLLSDGGHTALITDEKLMNVIKDSAVNSSFLYGAGDAEELENEYTKKYSELMISYNNISKVRSEKLGDGDYHSVGNTAVISFDKFEVDYQGWEDYFGGKTSAMPHDTVSIVYNGLRQARAEGRTNVIFDLSVNTGGDSIAMNEVLGIISGRVELFAYNTLGDQYVDNSLVTDRNLDGVINEGDGLVSFDDMRFAVLSSSVTFSCGNHFCLEMKDMGVMTAGEQSGGGCGAVLRRSTADGVMYQMSGYAILVNSEHQSFDDGVPADLQLVTVDSAGAKDYSAMYDIERISREMDAFYASKQDESSVAQGSDSSDGQDSADGSQGADDRSGTGEPVTSSAPDGQSADDPNGRQNSPVQEQTSGVEVSQDSGSWIGTVVLVFVLFGLGSAGLLVFGIIYAKKH